MALSTKISTTINNINMDINSNNHTISRIDPSEEVIILDFTCCMTSTIAISKWLNSIFNQNNIQLLLDLMQDTWSNLKPGRETDIMTKYAEDGKKYCFYYCMMFYVSMVIFLLLPMRDKLMVLLGLSDGPAEWAFPYFVDYWIDEQKYFFWIELHMSIGSAFTITAIAGPDLIFLVFMQHTCGMFAVIW
ncbi:uncharacterized protein [Chelonus insularis]|uniref:uncharacterized protein n=1 Tax=Chelonus insularis TaxID=460826 RepID=UPI00158A92D5|nr:uncharacterized protein LOC118066443 [Chelonus insularis]